MQKEKELIAKASENLRISEIFLREIRTSISPKMPWEAERLKAKGAEIQFLDVSASCERGETENTKGEKNTSYIFTHRFGIRLLDINGDADVDDEDSEALKIEADYHAVYDVADSSVEFSDEELAAFGKYNVPYHLWPYWRELADSTARKMGITNIIVPMKKPVQSK